MTSAPCISQRRLARPLTTAIAAGLAVCLLAACSPSAPASGASSPYRPIPTSTLPPIDEDDAVGRGVVAGHLWALLDLWAAVRPQVVANLAAMVTALEQVGEHRVYELLAYLVEEHRTDISMFDGLAAGRYGAAAPQMCRASALARPADVVEAWTHVDVAAVAATCRTDEPDAACP